jgi:hypothetical protein
MASLLSNTSSVSPSSLNTSFVYCEDSITAVTYFSIATTHSPILFLRTFFVTYYLLCTLLSESLAPVALELFAL